MDKKRVVLLVRRSPLNSMKAAEALRQGVGLTTADGNNVTVILLDAAAWLAVALSPQIIEGGEIQKHLDYLPLLQARVKVEAESLAKYGIAQEKVMKNIQVISQKEVVADITGADVAYAF